MLETALSRHCPQSSVSSRASSHFLPVPWGNEHTRPADRAGGPGPVLRESLKAQFPRAFWQCHGKGHDCTGHLCLVPSGWGQHPLCPQTWGRGGIHPIHMLLENRPGSLCVPVCDYVWCVCVYVCVCVCVHVWCVGRGMLRRGESQGLRGVQRQGSVPGKSGAVSSPHLPGVSCSPIK